MKLIKTRDLFLVDAHVPFQIDEDVVCDEDYTFQDETKLIKSNARHFQNLKGIFPNRCKSEMLEMTFFNDSLLFKGDINKIRDYTIQSKNFEIYGNYMCNGDLYKQ